MNETEFGILYDVSFDTESDQEVIYIDTGDKELYLTTSDLEEMLYIIREDRR